MLINLYNPLLKSTTGISFHRNVIMNSEPSLRILLVEDDIDDCMFFKDALNETGINTTLQITTRCTDILKLLGNVPEKLPDLIFLDLNMPLVSGHECLKEIRSLTYLNSVPVVIY